MNTRQKGTDKEQLAAEYLDRQGMRILEKNFRARQGEIDLIGLHEGYLVFVEVKLRKTATFAQAYEYVDKRKQNKIRTTASVFLSEHPTELQPRFDIIEIYAPDGFESQNLQISHLEGVF